MPANNRAGRIRSWMPLLASCLVQGLDTRFWAGPGGAF